MIFFGSIKCSGKPAIRTLNEKLVWDEIYKLYTIMVKLALYTINNGPLWLN